MTTTEDSGAGSLRAALAQAEASAADDHITFAPSVSGTIQLTSGQLEVVVGGPTGDLTVEGPGADVLTVDGANIGRVLDVRGLASDTRPTLIVSGLTLTRGASGEGGAFRASGTDVTLDQVVVSDSHTQGNGGGVFVAGGSLLVTASMITRNVAGYEYGVGGGIAFDDGDVAGAVFDVHDSTISDNRTGTYGGGLHTWGTLTVTSSIVSGNTAAYTWLGMEAAIVYGVGGGISAGDLTVVDSRITDNEAGAEGGGLSGSALVVTGSTIAQNVAGEHGGGIHVDPFAGVDLRLQSSTVTGNRADVGGGLHVNRDVPVDLTLSTIAANAAVTGGGLYSTTDASLRGTIVAMNTGGDLAGDGSATLDHSLVRDPRSFPYDDISDSIIGEDPLLGPLADNGGGTRTMLQASNSPVIDGGSAFGETTDQRGSPRPADGADIGAVELTEAELTGLPQVANISAPIVIGQAEVGQTLHTDGGGWAPEAEELSYQWLRDGVPIAGATSASYTLTADDFDRNAYGDDRRKRVSVRVTAAAADHRVGAMESDYTRFVRRGVLVIIGRPRVTGKLTVGSVLRARPRLRAISPRPTGVFVRWYIGDRPVDRLRGARRLELMPWMRGKRVKVTFSYRPPAGYKPLNRVVKTRQRVS